MAIQSKELDRVLRERAAHDDIPMPEGFQVRLTEQLSQLPLSGFKRRHMGRRAVAVLAAAMVLTIFSGAAALTLRQNQIRFFDSEEELIQAAQSDGSDVGGYSTYEGADYEELGSIQDMVNFNMEHLSEGETEIARAQGGDGDGWTEMRTVEYTDDSGVRYQESCYQADSLSGLDGLCPQASWNLDWLETQYSAAPGAHLALLRTKADDQSLDHVGIYGEYTGADGQLFNLQYTLDPDLEFEDEYHLDEDYDVAEYYETKDGIPVAIEMTTSHTGQSIFWVNLQSGHTRFSMFGTRTSLDEIKAIVDSLNLSSLCEWYS